MGPIACVCLIVYANRNKRRDIILISIMISISMSMSSVSLEETSALAENHSYAAGGFLPAHLLTFRCAFDAIVSHPSLLSNVVFSSEGSGRDCERKEEERRYTGGIGPNGFMNVHAIIPFPSLQFKQCIGMISLKRVRYTTQSLQFLRLCIFRSRARFYAHVDNDIGFVITKFSYSYVISACVCMCCFPRDRK